jgi:hypothetical protein
MARDLRTGHTARREHRLAQLAHRDALRDIMLDEAEGAKPLASWLTGPGVALRRLRARS